MEKYGGKDIIQVYGLRVETYRGKDIIQVYGLRVEIYRGKDIIQVYGLRLRVEIYKGKRQKSEVKKGDRKV